MVVQKIRQTKRACKKCECSSLHYGIRKKIRWYEISTPTLKKDGRQKMSGKEIEGPNYWEGIKINISHPLTYGSAN